MEQIKDYKELSKIIFKYFKRNVKTNCFLSTEDLKEEILESRISIIQKENYLLIFRKRESFYILNYYLNNFNLEDLSRDLKDKKIVVEVVGKNKNNSDYLEQLQIMEVLNFKKLIEREHFEKQENSNNVLKNKIEIKNAENVSEILDFLKLNFSEYTGCIPIIERLKKDILNSFVIEARIENEIAGILHYTLNKNTSEIKHLAVLEAYRGKGIANDLVNYYENLIEVQKKSVWTGKNNLAAQKVYLKNGYIKDEYISTVYIKD